MTPINTSPKPLVIFAYNRLDDFIKTVEALGKNELARQSELYIFSDGAKEEKDINVVLKIRNYSKQITGFKKVYCHFAPANKGLANSIIHGVSLVLENNDSVIVLEDDLVVSSNFLHYMNQALIEFKTDSKVFSIAGYGPQIKIPVDYPFDNYFTKRASSWGWATWRDRWEIIDWEVSDYETFALDNKAKREFNKMGSDMSQMLKKQMLGEINSWAIRWCFHQFKYQLFTVYPLSSKVLNIGFGKSATHTSGAGQRYAVKLDVSNKKKFVFDKNPILQNQFVKQFVAKYSLKTRIYYKVRSIFNI